MEINLKHLRIVHLEVIQDCAEALLKKCKEYLKYTPTLPSPFEDNQSSKPSFEFGWKVIAIGYGHGFCQQKQVCQIFLRK
jgi:hypothetical protein